MVDVQRAETDEEQPQPPRSTPPPADRPSAVLSASDADAINEREIEGGIRDNKQQQRWSAAPLVSGGTGQ